MDVEVTYGGERQSVTIPDGRFLGVLQAPVAGSTGDGHELERALASPLGKRPLAEFAAAGEPVLVLVNDATRPTPTAAILSDIRGTIADWDITFLVATGTHGNPGEEECRHIFGDRWDELRGRVRFHDAGDASRLTEVGVTTGGTRVYLNSQVAAARKLLVLGSVEAHYFAGYTGGRKILLPGVAGRDSIEQNHRLAMEPQARALRLKGNPVHEDMDQVIDMLPGCELFAVQVVLDRGHRLCFAAAGDIREAFTAATRVVDETVSVPFSEKADIVLAVAEPPLDCNFYQAQKSIENGRLALKQDGILILASACGRGTGSTAFLGIMEEKGNPQRVLAEAESGYRLGYHKAARLARAALEAELWAVTGVEDEVATTAFMRPRPDIQAALDEALAARPGGKVLVLMDAGATVPRFAPENG